MLYMYSIVYAVFPLMHISEKFTHNKIIFTKKRKQILKVTTMHKKKQKQIYQLNALN